MDIEDYQFIEENLELIKKIVINASCSFVPIVYKDRILQIGKKYKYITCSTCNSNIYLATTKLYDLYLNDKNIKEENEHKSKKVSRKR